MSLVNRNVVPVWVLNHAHLPDPFCKSGRSKPENACPHHKEGQNLWPERPEAGPFEKDAAHNLEIVPHRIEERQPLKKDWHAVDREHEAGQKDSRLEEEKARH